MVKTGVIADDFTGAADIASFMVEAGWKILLFNGIPPDNLVSEDADAVVIALKNRSVPAEQAVDQSLAAGEWLLEYGFQRLFFNYCSTFDSSPAGNIGPVTDALMKLMNVPITILCPAVPANGRTVLHGHLFVNGSLLHQSGMEHHPVTPMLNSSVKELMEEQSIGLCGIIDLDTVKNRPQEIDRHIADNLQNKNRYLLFDAIDNQDLLTIARATRRFSLLTGAAGLAEAIVRLEQNGQKASAAGFQLPLKGGAVILSGSCSSMAHQQVTYYSRRADTLALDIDRIFNDDAYLDVVVAWVGQCDSTKLAPLIYATQPPQIIEFIHKNYGARKVSEKVERFFSRLAAALSRQGVNKFIVAGGETSGAVIQGLNIKRMAIGHAIAPGVPWIKSIDSPHWMILKSGNSGGVDFFLKVQEGLR